MATLPDASTLGLPAPQASQGIASYQPHTRMEDAAAHSEMQAGRALQDTGDILKNYQDKQDSIVAMDAVNRLKEASLNLAQDPDNGFQNVKGNAVVGQPFVKQYQDRFGQQQSSIANGLANDNQRRMFAQHAEVVGLGYQSDLYHHQAKETQVFNSQTRNDTIDLSLKDIAAHPYDDQTYDKNVAIAGQTVVAQGKDMGLTGQALADYTKSTLSSLNSKALMYRTEAMSQDNPMIASDFFHKHELEFDPQTRLTLGQHLKTATDAQVTHLQGQKIVNDEIATRTGANAPMVPANMGSTVVSPSSQQRMDEIVNLVKKPSPYDKFINDSATKYNISPTELKLRMATESSMNPNSDNGVASGLMGFTSDTAKQYGIDPKDPAQAIDGAARLMASAGGTLGGDMSKVDRTYYGGNANAAGPNTNQYAENMRATRAQLYGGNTPQQPTLALLEASEGSIIKKAQAAAESYRPGDSVLKDQFVAEALKNLNHQKQSIQGQNYNNFSNLLSISLGDTGAKSLSDLSSADQKTFSELPPQNQHSLLTLWKANQTQEDKVRPSDETDKQSLALMGEAINDPYKFKSRDIVSDTSDLPRQNRNQIYAVWQSIDKNMAKGANYQHALNVMRPDMEIAKIKFPDKAEKGSKESYDDYNAFTKLLGDQVDNFQINNKRNPTDKEIKDMAKPLLGPATVKGGSWMGFGDKSVSAFQINQDNESHANVQLTPDEKAGFTATLTNRYGYTPSDSQIQQAKLLTLLHPNDVNAKLAFDKTMKSNKPPQSLSGQIPK